MGLDGVVKGGYVVAGNQKGVSLVYAWGLG